MTCGFVLAAITVVQLVNGEHMAPGHKAQGASGGTGTSAFLASSEFRDELHQAIGYALGAGHDLNQGRLANVQRELAPMWRALAKNEHGRIDKRSLRYVVHRYLLKKRSISITGLEPLQHGSSSEAVMLTDHAPAYVRQVLEGGSSERGFNIEDAVAMIAMMEEFVSHSSHKTLEKIFHDKGYMMTGAMTNKDFEKLMETYLLRWMMGNDTETIELLEMNATLLYDSFDDWSSLVDYAKGVVEAFKRSRWHGHLATQSTSSQGVAGSWRPMRQTFSFDDAQAVISSISMTFGRYWHNECVRVKESLTKLDRSNTGRVRLADFHGAALDGEWRFSESREYLRQLGALDESSDALGPRVIVPNYLQGPSNCIISDTHYRLCCANDCEGYMSEIEDAVGAPLATADEIVAIVSNLTISLDDASPTLTASLRSQLEEIANTQNGKVPLHGRLFSQWLHYVFPQDCPFPHRAGSVSTLSPLEFGDDYMATEAEIEQHVSEAPAEQLSSNDSQAMLKNSDEWMAQWSQEEELLTEHIRLHAPWEFQAPKGAAALVALVILVSAYMATYMLPDELVHQCGKFAGAGRVQDTCTLDFMAKAHFV